MYFIYMKKFSYIEQREIRRETLKQYGHMDHVYLKVKTMF